MTRWGPQESASGILTKAPTFFVTQDLITLCFLDQVCVDTAELSSVYCPPWRLLLGGYFSWWISSPGQPCTKEKFLAFPYKDGSKSPYTSRRIVASLDPIVKHHHSHESSLRTFPRSLRWGLQASASGLHLLTCFTQDLITLCSDFVLIKLSLGTAELFPDYCPPWRLLVGGYFSCWISSPGLPCTREKFLAFPYKDGCKSPYTSPRVVSSPDPIIIIIVMNHH